MSSKQSRAESYTTGSAKQANIPIGRRRKSSSTKHSGPSKQQELQVPSEATPDYRLLKSEAIELSSTGQRLHLQDSEGSPGQTRSHKHHHSTSHPSKSLSESDSEYDSETSSDEQSDPETAQIHAPLAISPRIHPLLASLRSSSSRSPSRPGHTSSPGRSPFSASSQKPSPHLSPPLPSHLKHLSPTRSRPGTPSESEHEAGNTSTETHVTPRVHSVPSHEYYGFALYISSLAALIIYVLWSFLPHSALHALGIYYYPSRWWSLAIPAWIVMAIVFEYVALALYNIEYLTLPMTKLANVVDEVGIVAVLDKQGRIAKKGMPIDESDWEKEWNWDEEWEEAWSMSTDAVLDVPIGGVCEVLYGDG